VFSDSDRKSPEHLLAPIIVHETGPGKTPPDWTGGKNARPRVYLLRSEVEINGGSHPQLSYCWRYEEPGESATILRMTLDSGGYPAIFELLDGSGGLTALYASRGLEQAARKEYGAPVVGTRYSLEPGASLKVDGLVEDGPVAMGPLVYVAAVDRQVVSLTCRCSPSKIETVAESLQYSLNPTSETDSEFTDKLPPPDQTIGALRLPKDF
jgi:hypothetical protein